MSFRPQIEENEQCHMIARDAIQVRLRHYHLIQTRTADGMPSRLKNLYNGDGEPSVCSILATIYIRTNNECHRAQNIFVLPAGRRTVANRISLHTLFATLCRSKSILIDITENSSANSKLAGYDLYISC
jgi:hypothetical protein